MGLTIRTSNRLERLAEDLAHALRGEQLDPLAEEIILVPGRGMARWLQFRLAQHLQIAAGFSMPFPGAFLEQIACHGSESAAWERGALTFRIYRELGKPELQQSLGPASSYCQNDVDGHKRLQLATRIAQCFDDYQLYRPELLETWQRGRLSPKPLLNEDWQARLWQALLRESRPDGAAARQGSLFERGTATTTITTNVALRVQRVRDLLSDATKARSVLPSRLSVFGLPTLPRAFLDILQKMGELIDVCIYLPRTTPGFLGEGSTRDAATELVDGHPLLAYWGKQARELEVALSDHMDGFDDSLFVDPGESTLLRALQSDLLRNESRSPKNPYELAADDVSLTVHGAHSPMRELEIVRDQLLDAFARNPDLKASDVLVLVPDMAKYAPCVEAAFGPLQDLLPYDLADRSPASDQPVPAAFLHLCRLFAERFRAPDVLLLLDEPVVARTFDIQPADLPILRSWVDRAAIRWGIDGAKRARDYDLPAEEANSWYQGMERLVLGMATGSEDSLVHGRLPTADGSGGRIDLLGRFLAFLDAVFHHAHALAQPATLKTFADNIEAALRQIFAGETDDEPSGSKYLLELVRTLRDLHAAAPMTEPIPAPALVRWLERELEQLGDARGFFGGSITVAGLQPMRAIPVRVLCICGLDDQSFPRRDHRDTFDLAAAAPRPLDRQRRDDDRQLFLDSLLAVRDQLVLTYVAKSAKDNKECAPSPVLSELLEHLDRAFAKPGSTTKVSEQVFVQHPLQGWSPRYGTEPRLFTYAQVLPAKKAGASIAEILPAPTTHTIQLSSLLEFWIHPTRYFGKNVLQIQLVDDREDVTLDAEPFAIDGLARTLIGGEAVRARLESRTDPLDPEMARASGRFSPGTLGSLQREHLAETSDQLTQRIRQHEATDKREVRIRCGPYEIHGVLEGLGPKVAVTWRSSKLKWRDTIQTWIRHLVLQVAAEDDSTLPRTSLHLTLDKTLQLAPYENAREQLVALIEGYRLGHTQPLPVFEFATVAYIDAQLSNDLEADEEGQGSAEAALERALAGYHGKDDKQPYYDLANGYVELCWRGEEPLTTSLFAEWAQRVVEPMFRHKHEESVP